MAGYCMSVWPYLHELQVSENTAQECNVQPYCLLTHQIYILCHAFSGHSRPLPALSSLDSSPPG